MKRKKKFLLFRFGGKLPILTLEGPDPVKLVLTPLFIPLTS